jgi:hypothetical protein
LQAAARHCVLHGLDATSRQKHSARTYATGGMYVAVTAHHRRPIMDFVYLGLTVGFFAVSLALVELFDRL